jgi:hypothetical protein
MVKWMLKRAVLGVESVRIRRDSKALWDRYNQVMRSRGGFMTYRATQRWERRY